MVTDTKQFKIVLLLESKLVQAWIYKTIEEFVNSSLATVEAVVYDANAVAHSRKNTLLLNAFLKLERKKHKLRPNALKPVDCSPLLKNIPQEQAITKKQSFEFDAAMVKRIHSLSPDIILDLRMAPLMGEVLNIAPHGVWSYQFGGAESPYRPLAGIEKFLSRSPSLYSSLIKRLPGNNESAVLYESRSAINEHSARKSINPCLWKSTSFVTRALRNLHAVDSTANGGTQSGTEAPSFDRNGTTDTVANLSPLLRSYFVDRVRGSKGAADQWGMMYCFSDEPTFDFSKYQFLMSPRDRFWADPFLWENDGKYYVFVEELFYSNKRGRISVLELDEHTGHGDAIPIIEHDYHMSYPFLLEWENELYMIPETSANQTVDAYRCVEFPHKWTHHKTLMHGISAADVTLFEHDKRWWIFANVVETQGASSWDELFLFSADHPFSTNWQAHPANPVISDVHTARPAGNIFRQGGQILRPSQNSSHRYGYGLNLNRIEELSLNRYRETTIESWAPDWAPEIRGLHTYNRVGRLSIIDVQVRHPK